MRLLVIRPEPDAAETAARLIAMGHEVIVQPMLRIVFSPPPDDLPAPAALIATSRNGVRALAAWPVAAGWRRTPLFVTGDATAAAAAAAGFADVRPGGADAAVVADRIVRDLDRTAGTIVYAAARDRAGALSARLAAVGYAVRTVEAYRAEPVVSLDSPVAAAFRAGQIDGVLFFSARTAAAFVATVSAAGLADSLRGVAFYALSERVAAPLRPLGAAVHIAAHPDFHALAALIPPTSPSQLA